MTGETSPAPTSRTSFATPAQFCSPAPRAAGSATTAVRRHRRDQDWRACAQRDRHHPAGDVTDADGNGNTGETLPIDARGFARDVGGVDIGAVELQQGATYSVTTLDDQEFDGGDLAAELADGGGLSLREALALANARSDLGRHDQFRADLADGR